MDRVGTMLAISTIRSSFQPRFEPSPKPKQAVFSNLPQQLDLKKISPGANNHFPSITLDCQGTKRRSKQFIYRFRLFLLT